MQKTFNISYNITPCAFENNYNTSCGGAAGLPDSKTTSIFHSHNNTTPFDLLPLLYLPPILWPGFHDQRCQGIRVRCTSTVTLPCGAVPHRCPNVPVDGQVNLTRLELDIYMHAFYALSRNLPVVFSDPMHAALKQAMDERGPNVERGPVPPDIPCDMRARMTVASEVCGDSQAGRDIFERSEMFEMLRSDQAEMFEMSIVILVWTGTYLVLAVRRVQKTRARRDYIQMVKAELALALDAAKQEQHNPSQSRTNTQSRHTSQPGPSSFTQSPPSVEAYSGDSDSRDHSSQPPRMAGNKTPPKHPRLFHDAMPHFFRRFNVDQPHAEIETHRYRQNDMDTEMFHGNVNPRLCSHPTVFQFCAYCGAWICACCGTCIPCSHWCKVSDMATLTSEMRTVFISFVVDHRADLLRMADFWEHVYTDFQGTENCRMSDELCMPIINRLVMMVTEQSGLRYNERTDIEVEIHSGPRRYISAHTHDKVSTPHRLATSYKHALVELKCKINAMADNVMRQTLVVELLLLCPCCLAFGAVEYCPHGQRSRHGCGAWLCLACGYVSLCMCSDFGEYVVSDDERCHTVIEFAKMFEFHRDHVDTPSIMCVNRMLNADWSERFALQSPRESCSAMELFTHLPFCDWVNVLWEHERAPWEVSADELSECYQWKCCGTMVLACACCMQWVCSRSVHQNYEGHVRRVCQRPAMHCTCHRTPYDPDPTKSRQLHKATAKSRLRFHDDSSPAACLGCDGVGVNVSDSDDTPYDDSAPESKTPSFIRLVAVFILELNLMTCLSIMKQFAIVTCSLIKRATRFITYSMLRMTWQLMIEVAALTLIAIAIPVGVACHLACMVLVAAHGFVGCHVSVRSSTAHCAFIIGAMVFFSMIVRTNAAGKEIDDRKHSTHENYLPGVSKWNGRPFFDFQRLWWPALCVALGTIAQDGYTLLQTARAQDPAGEGENPDAIKRKNRRTRLFACILNYISHRSYIYRYARQHFDNDGTHLFDYLYVFGQLAMTEDKKAKLASQWEEATMYKVCGRFNHDSIWEWAEWVDEMGDRLEKGNRGKRVKFLEGFPQSFAHVIMPEKLAPSPGHYVFPDTYPSHHPRSGNAHPKHGQPDIFLAARAYYPEWARMLKARSIQTPPKGSVYQADSASSEQGGDDDDDSDDDENSEDGGYQSYDEAHARMSSRAITWRSVCIICGGLGHAGVTDGVTCPSKSHGQAPNESVLKAITYPKGITRPNLQKKSAGSTGLKPKPSLKPKHKGKAHEKKEEESLKVGGKGKKPYKKHPHSKKSRKHARETEVASSSDADDHDDQTNESSADEDHHADLVVSFDHISI